MAPPNISPGDDFLIKQNPMQLYPKMPKVRVGDLQLGRKFSRKGKDNVQSYMEQTERMVVARQSSGLGAGSTDLAGGAEYATLEENSKQQQRYPFVDKGWLAMVRKSKRDSLKSQNDYIETVANDLITSAGERYETFIKAQVNSKRNRKLLLMKRIREREAREKAEEEAKMKQKLAQRRLSIAPSKPKRNSGMMLKSRSQDDF